MRWDRWIAIVVIVVLISLILPFSVRAAASDNQVLLVLGRVIDGVIKAGRDAYCAVGVTVFCP